MIPYGRQFLDANDYAAVAEVLAGDWLTQGPTVGIFEQQLCSFTGAAYAVAMANGTAALHAACAALELGPGDILWTSPISFVASANCARYLGAQVDFVDIDPVTRNISVAALSEKLRQAAQRRQLPKILVAVHFAGLACEMSSLAALAQEYGFAIIEDAAHALGSEYQQLPVGACQYSAATCFSFHPVKNITTGEGGAVLTADGDLAQKIRLFCTHGITKQAADFNQFKQEPWAYEQQSLGFNYRLTDIQAALGISQLKKIYWFREARQSQFSFYQNALANFPVKLPHGTTNITAWHLYVIEVQNKALRRDYFVKLRAANIGVNVHYIPIHLQPYYRQLGFKPGDFPAAENYYAGAISLPLFPALSQEQQHYIVQTLEDILCA